MITVRIAALVAAPILAGGLMAAAAPSESAQAEQPTAHETSVVERAAAADTLGYVIVAPAAGAASTGDTFYETGPIDSDTLVVIAEADGTLPGGITERELQELTAEHTANPSGPGSLAIDVEPTVSTPAASYSYQATSANFSRIFTGGSKMGYNESARASYSFTVGAGGQQNFGQGRGYYRGYNGSQFGVWSKFYGIGFATSHGGGGTVPWGNVLSTGQFVARCGTSTLCHGLFS